MKLNEPAHRASGLRARATAFGIHLASSGVVAVALVLLVTLVWYPSPLFKLARGQDIFVLLVSCDLILGPLMTFIVFNIKKPTKELVRDISIIAVIQILALGYGLMTLLSARPAFIVYNAGQFNVPLANELAKTDPDGTGGFKVSAPWTGPKLVGARLPADAKERTDLLFASVSGKGDVYEIPRYFVDYDSVKEEALSRGRTIPELAHSMGADERTVQLALVPFTKEGRSLAFLPLVIRQASAVAVLDGKTGDFLGIVGVPGVSGYQM